jgi:hypothetical protein
MNDIIAQFAEIIQDFSTSKEGVIGEKEIERSIIIFTNNTRLVVYEATTGTKFKYSYQWMNNQNQTIFDGIIHPIFPIFLPSHFIDMSGKMKLPNLFLKCHSKMCYTL